MRSRLARFLPSHAPTIVSVRPWVSFFGGTGYISAVSMKLMPLASAQSICAWPSLSVFCWPQVMVPRQKSVTSRALSDSRFFFRLMQFPWRRGGGKGGSGRR